MNNIKIGSHILTPRLGYTHHGIYAGRDRVIHYSGLSDGLSAGPIEVISLASFASGKGVKVQRYNNPKYQGKSVVERAHSRIGEDDYDLQSNNCEHLCTWAVTGLNNSKQVDNAEFFLQLAVPSVVVNSAIKARRHLKQRSCFADIAKDLAVTGPMIMAFSGPIRIVAPSLLRLYAAYRAIR